MKTDLTGYPKHIRDRPMSMYSKVVAVADAFDAATSRRVYQTTPLHAGRRAAGDARQPAPRHGPGAREGVHEPRRASIPSGTLVVLDTFELALVHAVNPDANAISRPLVRVISDERGNVLFPGYVVDLNAADPNSGQFARTIIKMADPERYGIKVSDYFV